MSKWIVTKRRYHGVPDGRFLIHLEGSLRGVCECWDADQAQGIADLMNAAGFRDPLENCHEKHEESPKDWVRGNGEQPTTVCPSGHELPAGGVE